MSRVEVHGFAEDAAAVGRLARRLATRRILSSDSVPHPTNAMELAGVLAAALREETTA